MAKLTATRLLLENEEELIVLSVEAPGAEPPSTLTAAETEIFELLRRGWSNRRIAEHRGTSLPTVAKQARSIYHKLGVDGRIDLALRWPV